jgi:hypothetical protein
MKKMTSNDKRSVSTDALETLGTIITKNEARDAIHLAVENVVAGERLMPGEHIGLGKGDTAWSAVDPQIKALGIVDPFLKKPVDMGKRFWLVVYPRQISSLRHVWEHPDFPPSKDLIAPVQKEVEYPATFVAGRSTMTAVQSARVWIDEYAFMELEMSGEELIRAASDYLSHGEYLVDGGKYEGVYLNQEFWKHYKTITGIDGEGSFFSCSC